MLLCRSNTKSLNECFINKVDNIEDTIGAYNTWY